MEVSEKEIKKEMKEHPWLAANFGYWKGREYAQRIALDHKMRKTTTKEGKTNYMRDYMREKRQKERTNRLPDLGKTLGMDLKKGK